MGGVPPLLFQFQTNRFQQGTPPSSITPYTSFEHSSSGNSGGGNENSNGGSSTVGDQSTLGQDLINAYEGLIDAVSHIIERVANALK